MMTFLAVFTFPTSRHSQKSYRHSTSYLCSLSAKLVNLQESRKVWVSVCGWAEQVIDVGRGGSEKRENILNCYQRKSWTGWRCRMIHLDLWLKGLNEFLQRLLIKIWPQGDGIFYSGCNHSKTWLLFRSSDCHLAKGWFKDCKAKGNGHHNWIADLGSQKAQGLVDYPIRVKKTKRDIKITRS